MFKLKPGFTKASVLAQIKKYNNGECAVDGNGACIYETDDGNRCAIGCFIPDNHSKALSDTVKEARKAYRRQCDILNVLN